VKNVVAKSVDAIAEMEEKLQEQQERIKDLEWLLKEAHERLLDVGLSAGGYLLVEKGLTKKQIKALKKAWALKTAGV
jgi:predicted rRNA methylase YqxC with S4 and FtsJ domains